MSGSAQVNAKLTVTVAGMVKACEGAMDRHIKSSVAYAKTEKRWQDQTGAATAAIQSQTDAGATKITSTIYGDIKTNEWLERSWFFDGRYKIIEAARRHNLVALWAQLRAIVKGTGFVRGG
jgi:hypothetical protein